MPIDERRVVVAEDEQWLDFNGRELQPLFTEGHARHHYCLFDPASKGVFTGDSFGISYRELDTGAGEFIYPTTTPASFDPDEAHKAVDLIMGREPQQLYLTHYSRVTDLERLARDMHDGIDAFAAMALDNREAPERGKRIEERMFEYLADRLVAHGFRGDRQAMWSVVEIDVILNSAGLVSWLERMEKRG